MLDTLKSYEGVHFRLQRQTTHILLGLGGEGQGLAVVFAVPGFYPREDVICDNVTGIVGQLGTRTFKVREVVLDVILKALEAFWQTFVESLTNLAVSVIDREMAEQMVLEIVDGVQSDEVDPNRVMEVFKVYAES